MSYLFYKAVHLIGIIMIVMSMGGLVVVHALGGEKAASYRKLALMTNGIGLLVSLVAGFGLITKLGYDLPWPGEGQLWVLPKIAIWILFAWLTVLARKSPTSGRFLWWSSLIAATLAAYFAVYKPF